MNLENDIKKFDEIMEHINAYTYLQAISHWDLATLSPIKGKDYAAKFGAIISGDSYALMTSKELQDIIKNLSDNMDKLSDVKKREVEILSEEFEKLKKIPKEDYQKFNELTSKSSFAWEEAKEKNDFEKFRPYLEEVVSTVKKFKSLTDPDKDIYNACLDDFEKGLTIDMLDDFFETLKETIVPLIKRINKEGRNITQKIKGKTFNSEKQKEISKDILNVLGFDFEAGVLAESVHPFTIGINPGDTRLTTRFDESDLVSSIFSSMHEGGHGIYDQNAAQSDIVKGTTLAYGASMAIHESQSRFFENIVGRSYEFWQFYYDKLKKVFDYELEDVSLDDFYNEINISRPDFIRTEADELTYNIHIIIRYEIEKDLFHDKIAVKDLPEVWNEKYKEYLGISPDTDTIGVLQDVHWSEALFGYFPTYALGNAYAAQILNTMKNDLDIATLLQKGNFAPITKWLNEKIHKFGELKKPNELIKDITGEELNPEYLTKYLKEKYEKIYFS